MLSDVTRELRLRVGKLFGSRATVGLKTWQMRLLVRVGVVNSFSRYSVVFIRASTRGDCIKLMLILSWFLQLQWHIQSFRLLILSV